MLIIKIQRICFHYFFKISLSCCFCLCKIYILTKPTANLKYHVSSGYVIMALKRQKRKVEWFPIDLPQFWNHDFLSFRLSHKNRKSNLYCYLTYRWEEGEDLDSYWSEKHLWASDRNNTDRNFCANDCYQHHLSRWCCCYAPHTSIS